MGMAVVIIDGADKADFAVTDIMSGAPMVFYNTHTPAGRQADSLCCIMHLFGVNDEEIPEGRAYLEALALNVPVDGDDLILRMNGVDYSQDKLISSVRVAMPPESTEKYRFYNIGSYKNLMVIKGEKELFSAFETFPPHENIGKRIDEILPSCANTEITDYMRTLCENRLWPWGEAVVTQAPSFYERHGLKAAVVCKTEIVCGMAKAMDMQVCTPCGATADTDTDLSAKLNATTELLKTNDIVFLHINGADEAAHRLDINEKQDFVKKIAREVITPLKNDLPSDTSLVVTADHITDAASGKHSDEAVCVCIFNPNDISAQWQKYL